MKLLGFNIERGHSDGTLSLNLPKNVQRRDYSSVPQNNWYSGPWTPVLEPFTGAWQRNILRADTSPGFLMSSSVVYACVTGIAADIAKMRIKLCREDAAEIWTEIRSGSPWLGVLRKPNHFQTRIKFFEQWILSKLLHGNTYVLKEREPSTERGRPGLVRALYVLHPQCVTTLVAADGGVYYKLKTDHLSQIHGDEVTVPASEIIHDMMAALWHPLVGVSPLMACALSAGMANSIQNNSRNFFANQSMPGGILTTVGHINDDTALRLKNAFETNFGGSNVGRVAVLGDGLKFEAMQMTAEAAQLAEQLKWSVSDVARAFHYPEFKLGAPLPPYAGNIETLIVTYYSDCLQEKIESIELLLDEGLELPSGIGTEFDLDGLLRMDTSALFESNNKGGAWMKIDEQRRRANLPPLPIGGNTVYRQHQDYSIEAIAKRDAKPDPFETAPNKG